jgi:hypothetical protein
LTPAVREQAEDEGWQLAEHFKLHLHPITLRAEHDIIVQPLPQGVPIEQIYADFLDYLFRSTKKFFETNEVNGLKLWEKLAMEDKIEFVVTQPNGWGGYEQAFLRKAVVLGNLLPASQSTGRLHFVSEAEASVHFVMSHSDAERRLRVSILALPSGNLVILS